MATSTTIEKPTSQAAHTASSGNGLVAGLWASALSLLGDRGRLVRFAVTGTVCGLIQLTLLHLLELAGWNSSLANATGFLISAQVNFLLSNHFIWGDRFQADGRLAL